MAALAIVAVASLARAVWVEREKQRLARAYTEAQQLVSQLADERAHLSEELGQAQDTLEGQAGSLSNLEQELQEVQRRLDEKFTELAALQQEQQQLRQENVSLAQRLQSAQTEKQQLEAKLSSIKELRLAIRDVRRKLWQQRLASWQAYWGERAEARKRADQDRLASGNRGYVVRHGTSTLGAGPRLHIHVLEPQTE